MNGDCGYVPGMVAERGNANDEVDGCACSGFGVGGSELSACGCPLTWTCARDDFRAGGEGGGGGMSVPAVRDSECIGIAGSWKMYDDVLLG